MSTANPEQSGFELLVIDDDTVQRKIIAKLAHQAGFATTEASSFTEAEVLLDERKFDCITLDLSLGSQHGAMLLRNIIKTGNRVSIVVISGLDPQVVKATVDVAQSLRLGAQFVNKPFNPVALRRLLEGKRLAIAATRETFGSDQTVFQFTDR